MIAVRGWGQGLPCRVVVLTVTSVLVLVAGAADGGEAPAAIEIGVAPGTVQDFELSLPGGIEGIDGAELEWGDRAPEELVASLLPEERPLPERWPEPEEIFEAARVPVDGRALRLRVMTHRCLPGPASYAARLVLYRREEAPLTYGLEFRVAQESGCTELRAVMAASFGGGLLLWGFFLVMRRRSHFLTHRQLISAIRPLRRTPKGAILTDEDRRPAVQEAIRRRFAALGRAWMWLCANPLLLILPGRRYREVVGLVLRRDGEIEVDLLPGREDSPRDGHHAPDTPHQIYARALAGGGAEFLLVPDRQGRAGGWRLAPQPPAPQPRVLSLQRPVRLLGDSAQSFAGWGFGPVTGGTR